MESRMYSLVLLLSTLFLVHASAFADGRPDIQQLSELANNGNARAELALGVLYQSGKGVPRDTAKAIYWYTRAARQNNAEAAFWLGEIYKDGIDVEQDYGKAKAWYLQSARNNYPASQAILGFMNERGMGMPIDLVEA